MGFSRSPAGALPVTQAERIRAAVRRSSDLVTRLGGDGFLVALRDVGPGDAVLGQVMHDLIQGLSKPVSVGVAMLPLHEARPRGPGARG